MNEIKAAIDKTEELTRQIWLAGLGAYGGSIDNLQNGYEKMNDQARRIFDDLVARGEKIETEAKDILDQASDRLKDRTDKLRAQADKLKVKADKLKGKSFKVESVDLNINDRLAEIRSKVSSKVSIPSLYNDTKIEELNAKIEALQKAVAKLNKAQKATKTAAKPKPKSPAQ